MENKNLQNILLVYLSYEFVEALSVELPAHRADAGFTCLPLLQPRVQ